MAKDNNSLATAFPQKPARTGTPALAAPAQPQPSGAIARVVGRSANALKRFESGKLAMKQTGTALLHTGETMGSLFLGSMAEGYVGPEKLKLGGIDLRAPLGMVTQLWGLYQIMSGEKGGEHALAIGNGVTGSWLSSAGREAGQALRERRGGAAAPPMTGQLPAQGGASFRGESPMVYIPPLEQEYPMVAGLLPEPSMAYAPSWQGLPQYAGQSVPAPSQAIYGGAAAPGQVYYPDPRAQYVQASPLSTGGFPQSAPQAQYVQASPLSSAGFPQPAYQPQPGLVPDPQPLSRFQPPSEPGPLLAGTHRDVMLTPENDLEEEPSSRPAPQMMLSPEDGPQDGFQGRRFLLTPEGRSQLQAGVQHRQQRRQAFFQNGQAWHQAQDAAQGQPGRQQVAQDPEAQLPFDPALAGEQPPRDDGFAGPGRPLRRAVAQRVAYNRFPSASALTEEPEAG